MIVGADFMRRLAKAAAAETLPRFRTAGAVSNKEAGGFDPVTEADRGAETLIRAVIAENFPDHAVIGEEWGNSGTSEYTWIIDPVDGTRAFISGAPVWGTLIGFAHNGVAIAGLMSQPFIGETFLAVPGRATYRRGDVTTVGGLVMELLGRVPRSGEVVGVAGYRIVVERVVRRRVERVYLEPMVAVPVVGEDG